MSIVQDRRCDGCQQIIERPDEEWFSLIPPGWDGEDRRLDFCNLACIKAWAKKEKAWE